MPCPSNTPFESIESAQDYLRMLSEELTQVLQEVEAARDSASASGPTRYLDAVRLACYKLQRLQQHIRASGRILNDLRLIRRILDHDVAPAQHMPATAHSATDDYENLGC